MPNNMLLFPQALYLKYLTVIEGIHFTRREVDVMACLLYARSTGKIASLLSLGPTTVMTHIKNIREKLKCNSRENIIDFVGKSHSLDLIKKHYACLMVDSTFKKSLEACSKLINISLPSLIIYCKDQQAQKILSCHLQTHLKLIGLEVSLRLQKPNPHDLQKDMENQKTPQENKNPLIILLTKEENVDIVSKHKKSNKTVFESIFVDFSDQQSYCLSVFEILKKLCPTANVDSVISQFKETCEVLERSHKALPINISFSEPTLDKAENDAVFSHNNQTIEKGRHNRRKTKYWEKCGRRMAARFALMGFIVKKRNLYLSIACLFCFLLLALSGMGFLMFQKGQENRQGQPQVVFSQPPIRSELVTPKEPVLLIRPNLIAQVDDKFKSSKNVQVVALVGPGGVGKTTLARYYARNQNASVAWEINAESRETLKSSYEDLAKALAKEEMDQKMLRVLNEIKKSKKREIKIIQFIKERLKSYPEWILIYDNFGKFTDIKDYFPQDLETWGAGKVLITTRNSNIQNNIYVDHVVPIGPLDAHEKYDLFWKIMQNRGNDDEEGGTSSSMLVLQDEQIKEFLQEIPPFPLDISVAAHYLKSTHTPYRQYIESSLKNKDLFITLQEDILKESGDYTKTRYRIIAFSLQQVMNINKDFSDLLLLIGLIDSQNIPRGLLNKYKDNETVDSLIYYLNQYSLVIGPSLALNFVSLPQHSTFSFHRSTHAILLNYLKKELSLKNNSPLISSISDTIERHTREAIENEDFSQMDNMKPHLRAFLNHGSDILSDNNKGAIETELGCAYYYTHYHEAAKILLTNSISNLKHHPSQENYQRLAQALSYLGNLHKDMGEHQQARNLLEEAIALYKQHAPHDRIGITRALTYLGDTYKNLGAHQKARDVLERSITLSQKHRVSNPIGLARTMLHLGIVYRDLGDYEKSIPLLKDSLDLFERHSPENYIERVRALKYLGNTYRSLGRYEEAKNLLEQSVEISRKYLPENHIALGRSLVHLAIIHKRLGEYKKAKELFTQSLAIHENIFGKDNVRTAWVMTHLATVHQEMGELERARDTISDCLKTYLKSYDRNSLRTSWVFMQLGYVYEDLKEYSKAQKILNTALKIHKQHFNNNHQKIGELLFHLSNVYKGLSQYKKAHELLERSLKIYERHYGERHIETARILGSLAHLRLCEGDLKAAEEIANKALRILNQHPSRFLQYEILAEIYLQKAQAEENKGRIREAAALRSQAIKELEQALTIIQPLFSTDSAHVIRIYERLRHLREQR